MGGSQHVGMRCGGCKNGMRVMWCYVVSQPFKEEVTVHADDLPDEAKTRLELEEKHAALAQLLSVKDQMITHLLHERSTLQGQLAHMSEDFTVKLQVSC